MNRLTAVALAVLIGAMHLPAAGDLRNVVPGVYGVFSSDYSFSLAQSPFKPYVQRLYTPSRVNVLRDQVPDHIHHHGLMFAVFVDGVDFWAETEKCGHQNILDPAGAATGTDVTQHIVWMGEQPLLNETRKIKWQKMEDPVCTLLVWESTLSVPEGKASSTLTGSHYTGLGMRFPATMDNVTRFFNSENAPGEVVRGDERNFVAKWNAATGPIDGRTVTVVMFSHPDNVRPATWFTMAKPFAYQSATLNLHKEPLTIEAGKPVTLKYAVAAFDGEQNPEVALDKYAGNFFTIGKVYDQFLKLTTGK